jgi:hypothetical protein
VEGFGSGAKSAGYAFNLPCCGATFLVHLIRVAQLPNVSRPVTRTMPKPDRSTRSPRQHSAGVSFTEVSKLGRALSGVTESTSYGTLALKVDGKLLARLKDDGETLVLRMDFVNRDLLLRAEPDLFFLTDHYLNYPSILLRLTRVTPARVAELLEDAWRLVAPRRRLETTKARGSARRR